VYETLLNWLKALDRLCRVLCRYIYKWLTWDKTLIWFIIYFLLRSHMKKVSCLH